jgi:NAD(P)-dependent dehydrogenase (short-subunit alcohol dehydrogenase family)
MPPVTLIYGATGGVGSTLARLLAREGHHLHLVARGSDRLQVLAEELQASWTSADVLDEASFARAADALPHALDNLVYVVGTINLKPLARLTAIDLDRDFRLNASGAALAVQAALPAMRTATSGASIVLFSSIAASLGFPLHCSMGMAKSAVDGLVRSLAAELAPAVRINAIALSLTQTPLASHIVSNTKLREAITALHPMRRLGKPKGAAYLAAYLLSPRSSWMTGQVIGVDGGRSVIAAI